MIVMCNNVYYRSEGCEAKKEADWADDSNV